MTNCVKQGEWLHSIIKEGREGRMSDTPDDDLNNVRYKANYRYETKKVLQRTYENGYNFTAVEMDWVVRGLFALHKQQPPEAAAIQQLINKLANTVYQVEPLKDSVVKLRDVLPTEADL
jgi:hypothetical protein